MEARLRIVEIPIVFVDRTEGQSKMSKSIVREAVWMVWRLRWWALSGPSSDVDLIEVTRDPDRRPFYKMSGSGNDFVMVDARHGAARRAR